MVNELLAQLEPWLVWLHLHPFWTGFAIFMIGFIECLALIGLVIPGTVIMTAIGALIGSHVLSAKTVFIPAMFGALLGDIVSFAIGYYYRENLRNIWPFKVYPQLLQKGENFFYRHGGKGVFIGRFIGPIRPMLPIIAGMLNMPPWRFFIADTLSAILWAPLYTLPGIILGAASAELAPDIALHLMLYVILFLLLLWCVSWLLKHFIEKIFTGLHQALDRLWRAIKNKPYLHPLHITLQDPSQPDSHSQLTLGLYFILMSSLFGFVCWQAHFHGFLSLWNYPVLFFFRSLHEPIATQLFLILTLAAEPKVWIGVSITVLLWLCLTKAYRSALYWGITALLALCSIEFFKYIIHSPRPWGLLITPSGYSFPSGHTAASGAILGFLAVLLSREIPKPYRWIPYTCSVLLILAIAVSRLYLGAHWLTDIVGSALLALSIVMLVTLGYQRKFTPRLNPVYLISVFLSSWIITTGLYSQQYYEIFKYNYSLYIPDKIISLQSWWSPSQKTTAFYRLNRFGKPAQLLNIDWAGNLENIQKKLSAQGWELSPNTTLGTILNRLNTQTKKLNLPVVPQLYLEKRPALIMTKFLDTDSVLMLTLWDSQTRFTNAAIPLWVGNISYYHIWQTGYFHLRPAKIKSPAEPAVHLLEKDISKNAGFYIMKQYDTRLLIMPAREENR